MPQIGDSKDVQIVGWRRSEPGLRPVVQVSLGCHVLGAANPHPCPEDTDTMVAGVYKRIAQKLPKPQRHVTKRLRNFVRNWIRRNLVPLSPTVDTSVETWLSKTNYPLWRRNELQVVWDENVDTWDKRFIKRKNIVNKCFMKDETYPEYKHARGIFSRADWFKCRVGPIFKLIEEELYQKPEFIKHVPVKDRPDYIFDKVYQPGAKYWATDYTAFESTFVRELMKSCEFELYKYMTKDLPCGPDFISLLDQVIAGTNYCTFRDFQLIINSTRMSGEMNTSLGNGFSNLMFMLFMCHEKGMKDVFGVVEGDDGLFRGSGDIPSSEDFKQLGANIKLVVHNEINTASFCGLVFDPDDRANITDPVQELLSFGWTTRRYARSSSRKLKVLLRCKALSLAHQYPGAPIIQELARYGLRVTRSVDVRHHVKNGVMSMWERDQLLSFYLNKVPYKEVGFGSRRLCEDLYNVSIDVQLSIEKYLASLDTLQPLDSDEILMLCSKVSQSYFNKYVVETHIDDEDMEKTSVAMHPKIITPVFKVLSKDCEFIYSRV